jgi:carboxypeptidase Taq
MLDLFEPQITAAQISTLFEPLRNGVIKLVKDLAAQSAPSNQILRHPVTFDQQENISQFAIDLVGLDPSRSRLDESEHPFTTGYADDVRITTHYLENDPMASFYSVLHEAGHALYETNLPREHLWTAIGNSVSLGIHESQSRFIENMVGKNPLFLEYFYGQLKKIIPGYDPGNSGDFIKAINAVIPSKIRIYADEVTYNLHIILRFELERDLFAGKVTLKEMPEAWNEKMDKFLGQKITEDKEGVLQDTHWYGGAFGYFPDYVLGNIYDGQLLTAIKKSIPDWCDGLKKGNISKIRSWLSTNVHSNGSLYDPFDLIEHVTGEKPSEQHFLHYLDEKFRPLFGI